MPYMDNKNADRLINTYADMILRISYMYLKHTYDAEDICQEIFLKLLSGEYIFNSPAHEKSWIIRTTINACKDHLRTTFWKRNQTMDILAEIPAPNAPESELLRKCHFNIPAARKTEATSNARQAIESIHHERSHELCPDILKKNSNGPWMNFGSRLLIRTGCTIN